MSKPKRKKIGRPPKSTSWVRPRDVAGQFSSPKRRSLQSVEQTIDLFLEDQPLPPLEFLSPPIPAQSVAWKEQQSRSNLRTAQATLFQPAVTAKQHDSASSYASNRLCDWCLSVPSASFRCTCPPPPLPPPPSKCLFCLGVPCGDSSCSCEPSSLLFDCGGMPDLLRVLF